MLNLKRIFLVGLSLIYIIFVMIFSTKVSTQEVLRKSQNNDLSSNECYNIGVKCGLKLSYDEYIMICSVVQGETGGANLDWSEFVAEVIKNRVISKDFPNTVSEVLTQANQFDAIQNYYNGIDINYITYQAVINVFTNKAYLTKHRLKGATFYCNPDILSEDVSSWFSDELTQTYDGYYKIDDYTFHHIFYK